MINVAIVDDHIVLREQFAILLNFQKDMQCVMQASSLGELFESFSGIRTIDVLLLDISLGALNSLDHLNTITRILPETKIIILTGHKRTEYLVKALQNGAHGYFLKSNDPDQLPEVIRLTLAGGSYIEPGLAGSIPGLLRSTDPVINSAETSGEQAGNIPERWNLNQREQQIMYGLLEGKGYKEIGVSLHISINTVRVYVKSLYRKLNVNNRVQLIKKWNARRG